MNDETKKDVIPLKDKKCKDKPRRLMGKFSNPKIHEGAVICPTVDILMNDAKSIIAAELAQYRTKVAKGLTLNLKEARVVQGYLDTLIKLQKEERENARHQDLSNLTDEELMELAVKLLGKVEEPKTE